MVQSEETGLLFNDEMDDFSSPDRPNNYGYPPSPANYIQPFKRPLSSMTPIMVEKDHHFLLALGGSGGSKIPTGVMNVLLQRILYQQPLAAAVSLPRLHDQLLPIGVNFEALFDQDFVQVLKDDFGHTVVDKGINWTDAVVQGVEIDPKTGNRIGACDWRKTRGPCETFGM
jgi:gamma-glutamyltranspeptidase/glutathione hydrolase/leukotriene-C4 hydrolase